MASEEESFLVLVHCFGKIQRSKKYGVKFTDREPLSVFISSSSTLSDVKNIILQKFGVFGSNVKYDTFVIATDEDIRVLFHCVRSFPEVKIHELYAKLEVGVDSSGASAPVASPSFAADLDCTEVVAFVPFENHGVRQQTYKVDTGPGIIHDVQGFGEPDQVENAMRDDDSDQEPVDIIGDDDDDTGADPHTQHGPSSSSTQQTEVLLLGGSSTEFQIGQSFQNKDEAVLSVKDYSIRRGVEYSVLESNHLKYHEKCKEFDKGYSWLIHIPLRTRKGTWEVRRADAAVTIKVLQEATEADYGFRPSYRKVWMAKQKAIAQIYGDWEESYAELLHWMLGVQSTMVGIVTVLKTSPVRLGDQVDEFTMYFHRLFWTFPPCIEAFRHWKPLVSIDGTHLYGKYGGLVLPIPEGLWPPYAYPTVIPDPNMRRSRDGCPKATKIPISMDQTAQNHPKRSGLYRQPSHMQRNYDQRRHTATGDA
ncbi:uncharacterized protein LOC107606790 [Arachis ipaensis]|uniref:uncharacterized protein LOC107606790 n=1 Tax=Arachis ipaensis TaxID=130454 RepID=UPI0007AEEC96|nr:uncharacterized protein LOC107606790 [Arachis ipaensis]